MSDRVYRLANLAGRALLRALAVDVRIEGLEHLPRSGPVLLASTHGSFLDFVVLERAAVERQRYVRFLTRHDVWRGSALSWAMDRMRHVPVDRAAPAAAYLRARRLLREGEAVGVFPEAGISHAFVVRSLMRGVAALARETGAPVVPVATWGAQRIWSVGQRPSLSRGYVVDVRLGEPRRVAPGTDLTAWTEDLGRTLTGMLEELQLAPGHRRPGSRCYPAHLGGAAPTPQEARLLEELPVSALTPTWGPAGRRRAPWAEAAASGSPGAGRAPGGDRGRPGRATG